MGENFVGQTQETLPGVQKGALDPLCVPRCKIAETAEAMKTPNKTVPETNPVSRQDLDAPELYHNRELTWLAFNHRVLSQARDERTPLLERVKFLAIFGSNLDEFFMKRIGGLKQQIGAGVQELTLDGRSPREQIAQCCELVRQHQEQAQALLPEIFELLRKEGIELLSWKALSGPERETLREDFSRNIYPLLTPQSIDPAHPFPFISNLSLNLLVTLRASGARETALARVKVPAGAGVPRFVPLGQSHRFVLLEDLIGHNLDMLFPGMRIEDWELFRITRNANTDRSEEHADDLLALIESALQERRFAPIVRMQVGPGMDPARRGLLAAELSLNESEDVFERTGMTGLHDLWQLYALDYPHLKDPAHHPVDNPALRSSRSIFHIIRDAGSILLHHPYESFSSSVERFLMEAAWDPKVRAVKMTLYRTAQQGRIGDYLIQAARNGKQVAVVVELKARFDEAANIRLANRMEEAGIHVTYGVVGLKTHSKIILVVRQDFNGLRRYVHIGTGNYHSQTSRIYGDLGLLSFDKDIGRDATELFNYLTTGYSPGRLYRKLLVAPTHLKKSLLSMIERETQHHGDKSPGLIQMKMNALEDADVARALYRASMAGVKVDLIVRDSCRLRPGIKGISENIRVISIVGRFLEHIRLYYFRNGGRDEYYIGSADAMKRNLEHRVEIVVPVDEDALKKELRQLLDVQLGDQRSAWDMQPDGSYLQRRKEGAKSSQELLLELTETRRVEEVRLKKSKKKQERRRNQGH